MIPFPRCCCQPWLLGGVFPHHPSAKNIQRNVNALKISHRPHWPFTYQNIIYYRFIFVSVNSFSITVSVFLKHRQVSSEANMIKTCARIILNTKLRQFKINAGVFNFRGETVNSARPEHLIKSSLDNNPSRNCILGEFLYSARS